MSKPLKFQVLFLLLISNVELYAQEMSFGVLASTGYGFYHPQDNIEQYKIWDTFSPNVSAGIYFEYTGKKYFVANTSIAYHTLYNKYKFEWSSSSITTSRIGSVNRVITQFSYSLSLGLKLSKLKVLVGPQIRKVHKTDDNNSVFSSTSTNQISTSTSNHITRNASVMSVDFLVELRYSMSSDYELVLMYVYDDTSSILSNYNPKESWSLGFRKKII